MKRNFVVLGLFILFSATSCKTLKTATSRDESASKNKATTVKRSGGVKFIDNIEVTPGAVVTSKHKTTNTTTTKKGSGENKSATAKQTSSSSSASKGNIENADYLQLKYALLLDATVEKLDNIPLLQVIDKWWGTRYCLGGTSETCIDCSAFTQTLVKDVYGISLPRTSQEQYTKADKIEVEDLQEGDLVFFHSGSKKSRISHVGFYLMNNKFVHASTSNGVMISDLNDSYWKNRFRGGGRVKA